MAIDSEAKRKSIAAIGLYAIGATVLPSGTFDEAQRQVVGYGYYGILAGEPVIPEIPTLTASPQRTVSILGEDRIATIRPENRKVPTI